MRIIALWVILIFAGQILAAKKPFCETSVGHIIFGYKHDVNVVRLDIGPNGLTTFLDLEHSDELITELSERGDNLVYIFELNHSKAILNEVTNLKKVNWRNLTRSSTLDFPQIEDTPILFYRDTTHSRTASFYITETKPLLVGIKYTSALVKVSFGDEQIFRKVFKSISDSLASRGNNGNAPTLTITTDFEKMSFEIVLDLSNPLNRKYLDYLLLKFSDIKRL